MGGAGHIGAAQHRVDCVHVAADRGISQLGDSTFAELVGSFAAEVGSSSQKLSCKARRIAPPGVC